MSKIYHKNIEGAKKQAPPPPPRPVLLPSYIGDPPEDKVKAYYDRCIKRIEHNIKIALNNLHDTNNIFSDLEKEHTRGRLMGYNRDLEILKQELHERHPKRHT